MLDTLSLRANRRFRLCCERFCHREARFAKKFVDRSLKGVPFWLWLGLRYKGLHLGLLLKLLVEGLSLLVLLVYLVFDKLNY